jgi:Ricin-type beta-trefoil lectin domain-like/Glycosyl hydrolases family 2, TIM barrel domain
MFKKICNVVLSLAFAACAVSEHDPSELLDEETTALSTGNYVIRSAQSGKCLDITSASTANGARVQQWDCNGTGAQLFRLEAAGSGFYKITNVNSNKALDVLDWRTDAGAPLQQWEYVGGAHQQFRIVSMPGGEVSLQARHSGLTLDVQGASNESGAAIVQWSHHGQVNQRWRFTRQSGGGTGPAPAAPITVVGRQVRVSDTPIEIRGVAWNPVRKGATHPAGLDFAGFADADIRLMRAAGMNAVRTYEPITDRAVLDRLHAAGIRVLMGVYNWGGAPPESVVSTVNAVKNHPAVLMWLIGNEWNYNGLYVGLTHAQSLAKLNEVAALIRRNDTAHPIATIYGELPSAATLAAMPNVAVWGLNVYRGISFGNLFSAWAALSGKPMFVSEYGADAYNANIRRYDPNSQAEGVRALTAEILASSVKRHRSGVVLGGTAFEWADEWWKDGGGRLDAHDVGGVAPGGGPYPDMTFNEEWWGIVDIDRNPRPAYNALRALFTAP